MDSPRIPDASSPVAILPPNPHVSYTIARTTEVTTSAGRRTTAVRYRAINPPQRQRAMVSVSRPPPSVVRTNNPFLMGPRGSQASAAGPTTRSRKRSHSSTTREQTTVASTSASVPPAAARAPSRKRKATPTSNERRTKAPRTARNRKKPPPGCDLKKAPPQAKCDMDDDRKPAAKPLECPECCICMCSVEPKDLAKIDGCDHRFCFGCIEKWSERENTCPLCKARFTKIDRIHKKYKKGSKNTKKVKRKDQRSDIASGTALEGLLANLHRNSGSLARIIFGNMEMPQVAISTTRSSAGVHAEFADSDDSDDDSPMAAFMRALHGSSVSMTRSVVTTGPISLSTHFATHHHTRSFARNRHDSTAGSGADNPLEIDDDSVDEVIEIE